MLLAIQYSEMTRVLMRLLCYTCRKRTVYLYLCNVCHPCTIHLNDKQSSELNARWNSVTRKLFLLP